VQSVFLSACISIALLLPSLAQAADAAPANPEVIAQNHKANAECFACHSEAGISKPPKAGLNLSALKGSKLKPEVFVDSNHGGMDCRECHGRSYNAYPHAAAGKTETSPCSDCHAAKQMRLEPQFNASVHAKSPAMKEKFQCKTCHDPHITLVAKKLKDPHKIVAQDNESCLQCHNSDETFAKFAPDKKDQPGEKKARPDIDAIHHWLPNTKMHWQAVRCVECHTPQVAEGKMLSHEILSKDKAEKNCLSCHARDSSLNLRLYRHLAKDEQQKYGFTNSVILSNSYVIGATRHPLLESIIWSLMALTVLGVLGHGLLRMICAIRRKKAKHD